MVSGIGNIIKAARNLVPDPVNGGVKTQNAGVQTSENFYGTSVQRLTNPVGDFFGGIWRPVAEAWQDIAPELLYRELGVDQPDTAPIGQAAYLPTSTGEVASPGGIDPVILLAGGTLAVGLLFIVLKKK